MTRTLHRCTRALFCSHQMKEWVGRDSRLWLHPSTNQGSMQRKGLSLSHTHTPRKEYTKNGSLAMSSYLLSCSSPLPHTLTCHTTHQLFFFIIVCLSPPLFSVFSPFLSNTPRKKMLPSEIQVTVSTDPLDPGSLSSTEGYQSTAKHRPPLTDEEWANMEKPKIVIVGAGIGGLMLGNLLQRGNIPFLIFDRAKQVKPLGKLDKLHQPFQPMDIVGTTYN